MALLPLVCCLIRTAAEGRSIGQVYLPSSEWNDELFYFKQVEGIVNYGFPMGYFGFNESHALQLSFAAWSPVLVFPWILWGLVFGWNLLSPVICNIVLMTVTMFVFVWLVKPTWKQLGILTVLFGLYSLFVRYMLSGMPEVICFSMLILFYGLAMSYLQKESKGKLIAMFVISVLLVLMRPYMLLFLALACFFWIREDRKWGSIGSVIVVAVTGILYVLIKHYLGAEYFTPLFYTDWITTFFTDGIGAGFRNFFGTLHWKGLEFVRHCIAGAQSGLASGAFFDGYLILLGILAVNSICDRNRLRRAVRAEKIVMEPADEAVRTAVFGKYTLTEEQKKKLTNQLIIEVHFAFSLIAMLFALQKRLDIYQNQQKDHHWEKQTHMMVTEGSHVLVIGLGDIGTTFARKMKALGAHVTGIRKSRKPKPEYVDAQYTMEALPELLPQADIVALSLPGYSDTKGVIGEKELHLMKENTILLNVGRGTAIDSLALAKALQEGAIYGAGLDVTDPEPLPEDHPLWDAPHCIITPHVSGGYALPETLEKILELSIENLERYEKGETLHNIIDFSTGYVKR